MPCNQLKTGGVPAAHKTLCISNVPQEVNIVQCNIAVIVHRTVVKIGALYVIFTDIFL